MKTLGIIGGMGPEASAALYQRITSLDSVMCDQEHFNIYIASLPQIPDRTAFIMGNGEDPIPYINAAARKLAECGADVFAMPCFTSHTFASRLEFSFINMIDLTMNELLRSGVKCFGLLATDGTLKSRVFHEAALRFGLVCSEPSEAVQRDVTSQIYERLKRHLPAEADAVDRILGEFLFTGAEIIVLGCTELSLVPGLSDSPVCIDPLTLLSKKCIEVCKC